MNEELAQQLKVAGFPQKDDALYKPTEKEITDEIFKLDLPVPTSIYSKDIVIGKTELDTLAKLYIKLAK